MPITTLYRRRWLALLLATSAPSALVAQAATPVIVEYNIPRAGNFPHDPAVGAD
jgi:hypothetical protein